MATEDDVRKVSGQFYAGLNRMANGDASAMADVWSHSAATTAMHPVGDRQVGWDAVKASFDQFAQLATDGKIELSEQLVRVCGDAAYEAGIERGRMKLGGVPVTIEHRVTNIYQREAGAWKMVHHHTDSSPALQEVIRQLGERSGKGKQ